MKPLSDLTAQCIRCGFCLESCPTFSESGSEAMSPRGRIHLAKLADRGEISWADPDMGAALDSCVGCRACETACPSGVEFGQILELARQQLPPRRGRRALLNAMTGRAMKSALTRAMVGRRMPLLLSRLVSGRAAEVDMPAVRRDLWPPMTEALPEIRGEVYLLEGCLMGTMFPSVQEATRRLLRRAGYAVRPLQGCCGALHAHCGMPAEAEQRQAGLARSTPETIPIIVDSAGCGSHMKEGVFRDRVRDISEFLCDAGFEAVLSDAPGLEATATYHDACHLAHGQKITLPPRRLLNAVKGLRMVPLREADLCCGSGGIYNLTQPEMARRLLERKWANIEAAEAEIAVLGNPGCHAWIEQAAREHGGTVRVMHTAEVLEAAFSGLPFGTISS